MGHDYLARRNRARVALAQAGIDSLLVTGMENIRYLSGFSGSSGYVVLAASGDGDCLVTDDRYRERAASECPDIDIEVSREKPWDQPRGDLDDGAAGTRSRVIERLGQTVGFEGDELTFSAATSLTDNCRARDAAARPTTDIVANLRRIKDPSEVALVSQACQITVATWTWALTQLRPGITERGLATAIERDFVDRGAESAAFPSIVAFGQNSATPHHAPTETPLSVGDLVKLDIGARVDGYHADMTRTVVMGEPTARQVELHAAVRQAQAAGLAAIRPDVSGRSVDAACRASLNQAGFGQYFEHGTGHGVGLAIHEPPWVGSATADSLPAQSIVTVEPGAYLPAFGGVRIEDTVLVTADGGRILTVAPRELVVI